METRLITFRKLKENCRLTYVYESTTKGEGEKPASRFNSGRILGGMDDER